MDGRVKAVLDDLHILYELIEIDPAFSDTRRKLTDRREFLQRV